MDISLHRNYNFSKLHGVTVRKTAVISFLSSLEECINQLLSFVRGLRVSSSVIAVRMYVKRLRRRMESGLYWIFIFTNFEDFLWFLIVVWWFVFSHPHRENSLIQNTLYSISLSVGAFLTRGYSVHFVVVFLNKMADTYTIHKCLFQLAESMPNPNQL